MLCSLERLSHSRIRGLLSSTLVFTCNAGILIMYILGDLFPYKTIPWILLAFPVLFLVCFSFIPDTPFYLMQQNNYTVKDNPHYQAPSRCYKSGSILITEIGKRSAVLPGLPVRHAAGVQRVQAWADESEGTVPGGKTIRRRRGQAELAGFRYGSYGVVIAKRARGENCLIWNNVF